MDLYERNYPFRITLNRTLSYAMQFRVSFKVYGLEQIWGREPASLTDKHQYYANPLCLAVSMVYLQSFKLHTLFKIWGKSGKHGLDLNCLANEKQHIIFCTHMLVVPAILTNNRINFSRF